MFGVRGIGYYSVGYDTWTCFRGAVLRTGIPPFSIGGLQASPDLEAHCLDSIPNFDAQVEIHSAFGSQFELCASVTGELEHYLDFCAASPACAPALTVGEVCLLPTLHANIGLKRNG